MVITETARGHVGAVRRAPAGSTLTGVLAEGGDDVRPFADEAAQAPEHTGIVRTVVHSRATGGFGDCGTGRATPHRGMHVPRKRRPVHADSPGEARDRDVCPGRFTVTDAPTVSFAVIEPPHVHMAAEHLVPAPPRRDRGHQGRRHPDAHDHH